MPSRTDQTRMTAETATPTPGPDGASGPTRRVSLSSMVSTPARVTLLAVLTSLAAVVIIRLGSSLIGLTTFSGADALGGFAPWRDQWSVPVVQNTWIGDTVDFMYPGYLQMYAAIWSGDLPLWSSLNGSGISLLSTPNIPTLSLPTLPLLLTPTVWAVGVTKLIQLVMIVAGMMLWLRRIGATWAAGAFAGLVYCGSGFFVAWSGWTGQTSVAAIIPLLFWSVEWLIARRDLISGLVLSLIVAGLLLGGFPAVAGHALYAAGVYFLVRVLVRRQPWRTAAGTIAGGALAVLGGVALSALQLLPLASVLSATDTAYRANQFHVQLPNSSAFTMFFPRLFLPHDDVAHTFGPGANPIEAYAFVGMAAAALAVLAVLAGRRTGIATGVVPTLAVIGLLSAAVVWQQGFWTEWLAQLPVFASNPSPRLRDLVALSLSALAGLGLNLLFRPGLAAGVRRRLAVAAWVMVGLGVVGAIGVAVRYSASIDPATFPVDVALALAGVVLVAVAFTALRSPRPDEVPSARYRWTRRGRWMTVSVGLLVVITGAQVLTSTAYFWPVSDRADFFPQTAATAAAQDATGSNRAVVIGAFPGSTAGAYGIRTVTGHTFQAPTWRDLVLSIDPKAYTPPGRTPTYPVLGVSLTDGSLANPILDRFAVGSVLTGPNQPIPGPMVQLDGAPSDSLGDITSTVRVGDSAVPASRSLSPMAVRGFVVPLGEPVGDGRHGVEIAVTVRDETGAVVAAGSAVRLQWPAGWHQIAVAGEDIDGANGALSVEVAVRSQQDPALQAAVGAVDGGPDLRPISGQDDGLRLSFADSQMTAWQRLTVLPRVRWADEAIVRATPEERLSALADPATPRSAVVLSEPGPTASGEPAEVTVGADTGDQVRAEVDAEGAGYLVLSDAIQSGWTVTVDGDPADLVEADHAFGAVFVPAGQHVVEFRYQPSSWWIGLAVSGVAALVWLGLLGYWLVRRRRARPSAGVPDQVPSADPTHPSGPMSPDVSHVKNHLSGSQQPNGQAG